MAWTFLGLLVIFPLWLVVKLASAHRENKKEAWQQRRFQLEREFRDMGYGPCEADDMAWKQTTEELGPWGQFFGLDE